jgi:hypothetical protein
MKDTDIGTLSKVLPSVFDLAMFDGDFGDDWIVINDETLSNSLNPVEECIVGTGDVGAPTSTLEGLLPNIAYDDRWPGYDRERDIPLPPIGGPAGGFPGAPGMGQGGYPPPPDAMGFYLPFHHFSRKIWGIYLLAEGVDALATDLVTITGGRLSRHYAVIAARAFIFHHEAYHSAVEAFGTRLEVAHREKVYIGGLRTMYARDQFEEAIATGYAINCVKSRVLTGATRKLAADALTVYVQSCAPPYCDGANLVGKSVFHPTENRFLEEALRLSVPSVSPVSECIWSAASYMTMPALRRHGRFTYLINRRSGFFKRSSLSVRYFDRRKLLQRLKIELGGKEVGGGRHPKWESGTGKRVPIPSGKDIDIGTIGSILKQFGIDQRPSEFMHG